MKWRTVLILIFVFCAEAAIISRLVFLQILNHDFYRALAEGQQKIIEPIVGERGEIFFKNGSLMAINKKGKYVFLCPNEIKDKEGTARLLSEVLGLDFDLVLNKAKKPGLFEPLKHRLSEEESIRIKEKRIKGVYLEEETFRYYPQAGLTSHITGFLGGEGEGQYGVEGFGDEFLEGKEVLSEMEKSPLGYLAFSSLDTVGKGDDIFLTIDENVQFMAEKVLLKSRESLNFESGQVLIMDPVTGKIVALYQIPSFDPNNYSKVENPEIFQSALAQKIFEPGSVFKPIVMAAALNEGKIGPETVYIDPGVLQIGGWPIYNYDKRNWGKQTMTNVLEKSINTGAVFVEQKVGHQIFLEYIEKFGFFERTGIELQGEVFSENREFKKGYEINFATASFGQGIEITPIQLARGFSAIANGGELIKPTLIEKIIEDGREMRIENSGKKQVISKKTSSQLTAMLTSVVENGFGKAARIEGYFVAGKTGTAQVPWPALGINKSGYSDKTIQTFVGFAPAFDPKFLIVVKLDNPQTKTAEYSAVPIFKEIAKYIIDYWEIPQDYE